MLVHDFLKNSASRLPAKVALVSAGKRFTYGELDAMTNRLALKIGYLWRYSNAPISGFKKSDSTETASIVVRWRSSMLAQ